MKLRALRLHNVKRFAGRGIAIGNIGDGVNVLTAANEYGKSTCFEALHALFFQPYSGTPGSVQMLRPYSGGNPLVEADIETESGRYRLTKQFYGGRNARVTELGTGRLIAQADEAERFIADLTRGGAGGPAGLLWVRQGLTGIEKRSKSEEESDRRVRETLLSSVQGEVEALTGGRRMTEILNSCEEALGRLVTATMRPKTGGPYADALEERDRLAALEQQLASDVASLREALDRRRAVMRHLARLEALDEAAALRAEITAAEEAYQAARSHAEILRAAEAGLDLAAERRQAAKSSFERFETALQRTQQLEQSLRAVLDTLEHALSRHSGAQADSERLEAEMQAAELAERQARQDRDRLDAAQKARDAAERFDAARLRLTEAESLRGRIEAADAALAALLVPDKAIEQLEKYDIELARLRAVQASTLPVLRIAYRDPARGTVSLAGNPLSHDIDVSFTGTVALDIADLGRLTIRSQHVDDSAGAIVALEEKLRALLISVGVASLEAARHRQRAASEKSNALVLDRQLLNQVAPEGIDRLRETVTRLDALRAEGLELKFDAEAIAEALRMAEARVVASRSQAREARSVLEVARNDVQAIQGRVGGLRADIAALQSVLGPEAGRAQTHEALRAALALSEEQKTAAEERLVPLRAQAQDLVAAEVTLTRLRSVADAAEQEILQNKEILADLNGQIRTQADKAIEENWQETRDLAATASQQVLRFEREVKTLDRLRKALTTARSSARDLYLKPVISELRPLIGLLFDDISVAFNEDTLLPGTVLRNGQEEDVDRLSGGMREQLSILTRLAFARLLAQDGRSAPVILDDALVYSDDDRIERMFEALHRQARDQQLIVFSCRQRAFSRLGGNVLTMSNWTPD